MNLKSMIKDTFEIFGFDSKRMAPTRWQGSEVKGQAASELYEMLHVNLEAHLGTEDLEEYRQAIKPNLPWADNHFEERVCGYPINPGVEWANWPWGVNAEKSLNAQGQFNHNYMERYWPQRAHTGVSLPTRNEEEFRQHVPYMDTIPLRGIRHKYGDLASLIRDLAHEPDTRQAYLPIWFPEDTGDAHKGRKPCTLGYHFIMRNGEIDVVYYMRSCDLAHHFRDDVYLTIRLLHWVLECCRALNWDVWKDVTMGRLVMQVTSMHMFINDYNKEYN